MAQQALRPSSLPPVDWQRWTSTVISKIDASKRDPLLLAENYRETVPDFLARIKKITNKVPTQIEPGVDALFVATRRRLWDTFDLICTQYCAGAPVEQIREMWPYAMRWAEEYAMFHEAHHLDPNNLGGIVPHAALRTEDYWYVALRLVCFGLLTGYAQEMPRAMKVLDYGNELMGVRDGLIERLVAPFVPGRGPAPDTATRHLPYRKLFKVFGAEAGNRPKLMSKYLDEWYEASRREPYIDQHLEGGYTFVGYWSWEAAAVTWLLHIDDASYRDKPFYPRDLIDYARGLPQPTALGPSAPTSGSDVIALRTMAGEPCPRTGWWHTPAKLGQRQRFEQGEIMPSVVSDYGATIWQWDERRA